MKKKTMTVKNEVPEILELLMNHPDCPEWLSMLIGDEMNNRILIKDQASWFRFCLNNIEENRRTVVHYPNRIAEILDSEVLHE